MPTRFPFATFAARLPDERRDVFANFAGVVRSDAVLAHIRNQEGLARPRAAPPTNWQGL